MPFSSDRMLHNLRVNQINMRKKEGLMLKKLIFGLLWFVIIFIVSYLGTGIIVVFPTISSWTRQAVGEATHAFRNTYIIFFAIGSLILTLAGTIAGVLPGTKGMEGQKKKPSAKKKACKLRKR